MSRRLLLNLTRNYATRPLLSTQKTLSQTVVEEFPNYMPKVIKDGLARASFIEAPEVAERLQEIAEYYTAVRKPVQGEFLAFSYEYIAKPVVNNEVMKQLQVLTATVEMVQSYYCFWDDLEDGSTERCGKQCWHLRPGVGLLAVNDACLLRSLTMELIEQNFDGEVLKNLLHIYNRNFFVSSMGQLYDTEATKGRNYENFTPEVYNRITRGKSSYYAITCPLLTALAFANKLTDESHNTVINLFNGLGILVQVQNDVVDYCISRGLVVGKSGTDIQEGKCSWPAVTVLQKCSPSERKAFEENYGSWDPKKVERIHELFEKYDVLSLYKQEIASRSEAYFKGVKALPENSTPSAEYFTEFYDLFSKYLTGFKFMYDQH